VADGGRSAKLLDMDSIVLLCTDGSAVSVEALRVALPLLAPADRTILVTVESPVAADTTTGTGFATAAPSSEMFDQIETTGDFAAMQILESTRAALGLDDVEFMAIVGRPGEAICRLAAVLPASIVVIGTSGRGGLRRAVMGSTSDYIVRHAACPVLVQGVGQS
jgi:nucleotide-binding universal stress UspA family protein